MTTPIHHAEGIWMKRDDLFEYAGVRGGKVRTCLHIATAKGQPVGLITAGARHSPQVQIVAAIGRSLGVPVRCHVPSGSSPELDSAEADGAELIRHVPGYNTVIVARARADAAALPDWTYIPFGMEHPAAVAMTARETSNVPWDSVERVVVPVGSGMSLAGVLAGMHGLGLDTPVVGVVVGRNPRKTLNAFFPLWPRHAELVEAEEPYERGVEASVGPVELDPIYEAKCRGLLRENDLLWIVGRRGKVAEPDESCREPGAAL